MKKILALALVTGAIAAPVALSQGDEHRSSTRVRMVEYVFKGVVSSTSDASVGIERAHALNRFAYRSLDGAKTFTVKLDGTTRIKNVYGRHYRDATLKVGDRVAILIRAPRGTAATELPAASFILDFGRARGFVAPPAPEPVVTPPAPTPPTTPSNPPPADPPLYG